MSKHIQDFPISAGDAPECRPEAPTKRQLAAVLGLAGDEFYNAAASRGVPSKLTLAMAAALLEKFDVTPKGSHQTTGAA